MHKQHGFTILELAITIVIAGILMTLATVGYQKYQVYARDQERKNDVAALQNYLESTYSQEIKNQDGDVVKPANSYPMMPSALYSSTSNVINPYEYEDDAFMRAMEGVPKQIVTAPGQSDISLRTPRPKHQICIENIDCHTFPENALQIDPTVYVYTSRNATRMWGHHGCVKSITIKRCGSYTIKYVLESDPNALQVVESKRQ